MDHRNAPVLRYSFDGSFLPGMTAAAMPAAAMLTARKKPVRDQSRKSQAMVAERIAAKTEKAMRMRDVAFGAWVLIGARYHPRAAGC